MIYDSQLVEGFANEIAKNSRIDAEKIIYIKKDVWLTYMLRYIYGIENAHRELVFKGGTSLVKCHYDYYRFSEDLDFTWMGYKTTKKTNRRKFEEKYIEPLRVALGLVFEETIEIKNGVKHSHSGKVLNYFFTLPTIEQGQSHKVKVNVSFDEVLEFPVETLEVKPFEVSKVAQKNMIGYFGKVASDYFDELTVPVYSKEEITCEKIRALLTRKEKLNRSRDIVDLFYLSKDVNLEKIVLSPECGRKLFHSLQISSYKKVFEQRIGEIGQYLENIVEYAKHEPIYLRKINYSALREFAMKKLKPLILKIGTFSSSA